MSQHSNELDGILTNLSGYALDIDVSNAEFYTFYPELKKAKQAILKWHDTEVREARLDELERMGIEATTSPNHLLHSLKVREAQLKGDNDD